MDTNAATVPPTCSARASAASFEDCSIRPYVSSPTAMRSPGRSFSLAPAGPVALAFTVTTSDGLAEASTVSAVMIFTRLAMGLR